MAVLVDDHLAERFQCLSSGDHLHEYIGTIAIRLDHPLDPGNLTGDFWEIRSSSARFSSGG